MSNRIINVVIYGICGRMGKMNALNIEKNPNTNISGSIENKNNIKLGQDIGEFLGIEKKNIKIESDLENVISKCDVIVDFTNPDATMNALNINKDYKKAFVIGTTGLNEEQNNTIKSFSKEFPIVYSPNFSIGVNVLFKLVEITSQLLNAEKDYDLEIIEAHHRYKKDSPSGTAIKLLQIASQYSGRNEKDALYGRKGFIGERNIKEIGMNVIRAGDIVGEHTILYSSEGERIEITHKAHSREAFSKGVVQAILFIVNKKNGLYSMTDVLGL